jgi:hypothetical protein
MHRWNINIKMNLNGTGSGGGGGGGDCIGVDMVSSKGEM